MSKFTERSTAPIENTTIVNQLSHRTFRRFTDERLTDEQVDTLVEVARRTATSSFLQQTTILHITDQRVRDEIAAASGQPYVGGDKGDLFVFLVDMYRNKSLREEMGVDSRAASSMNLFICAAEDAILAAQNTVTAAESMGLGTVFLGSILGDPRRLIAAMELPELTYPILGLLVGHSEQEPLYRPRLPRDVVFARNTYPRVDSFRQALAEYGTEVSEYYEARGGSARFDDFGQLVVASLGTGGAHVSPVLETLHEQGLCLF